MLNNRASRRMIGGSRDFCKTFSDLGTKNASYYFFRERGAGMEWLRGAYTVFNTLVAVQASAPGPMWQETDSERGSA